jgi:hypothetical protein
MAYEFQCTEADFRKWVAKARKDNPKLCEIRTESLYSFPTILRDATTGVTTARNVLISEWRYTDSGQYFIYDPSRGRAITWSNSR